MLHRFTVRLNSVFASGLTLASLSGLDRFLHCTVCHSAKFITTQKGDRDTWKAMIVWMQRTQGLWQFTPEIEDEILTYLETNYPPGNVYRRANLKIKDMPN